MKKKFELIKTIQLVLFFAITVTGIAVIFTDRELYQMVGSNTSVRVLCVLLWITMVLSFLFILWDFSTHASFKKDYRELDYSVYNDSMAGIANRYSCDAMIAKYADKPLPDTIGCVMLDISNIREINEQYGHLKGNEIIQDFSNILHLSSLGLCFVGRNGGNKFMALFEDCEEVKLNTFLTRVQQKVEQHNSEEGAAAIKYSTGRAFSKDEQVTAITQLISMADRRLTSQTDTLTGFASRASCDDIISLYLEKKLPDTLACIMLDISNIREINEIAGHQEGNNAIRQFGDALRKASAGLCFVGRNGGTKFLAIFEDTNGGKINQFLTRVKENIDPYNSAAVDHPVKYRYGIASHPKEPELTITQLVALSDRRLREDAAPQADRA